MNLTEEVYNVVLIMVGNLCLKITKKFLSHLKRPSHNRSAAASFDVEVSREENYNTDDLLSDVRIKIPKPMLDQKVIYD